MSRVDEDTGCAASTGKHAGPMIVSIACARHDALGNGIGPLPRLVYEPTQEPSMSMLNAIHEKELSQQQHAAPTTSTDLSPEATRELSRALNVILADAFALYLKTRDRGHVRGHARHAGRATRRSQSKRQIRSMPHSRSCPPSDRTASQPPLRRSK